MIMETKGTLIVDCLVLLILFCESCGRQVKRQTDKKIQFPGESLGNANGRIQNFNWYATTSSSNPYSGYTNAYLPYTNQNQASYPWLYANSFAPSEAYLDYLRKGREEQPSNSWLKFGDLDATMSSHGQQGQGPHSGNHGNHDGHQGYHGHHGYMNQHGELLKLNTKGFTLLGILGLLTILQGLLEAIMNRFTTTTTAEPEAANRSLRSIDSFPLDVSDGGGGEESRGRIMQLVLPSLSTISHVRSGTLPISCILHELCFINQILRNELPESGNNVGDELFSKIQSFLEEDGRHRGYLAMHLGIFMKARQRNHLDCSFYPICPELRSPDSTIQRPPPLVTLDEFISNYKNQIIS